MWSRSLWRGMAILLLVVMLAPPATTFAQGSDPVQQIIDSMPTRMKVGQLVLVAFPGTELGDETAIAALIREYAIGGVLLTPGNGNFGDQTPIAPTDFVSMTNRLQVLAWEASQNLLSPPSEGELLPYHPMYVPLFVATEAEASGLAITGLISGTSPIPSPLALGATWSPPMAESTGQAVGQELAALGINLFMGPDLDVLYRPDSSNVADLGTLSFGGDPYWVGEMGQAYIRGLHQGSGGQLAVVPRHFPGLGSADRLLQEEVPTVQKPLEQLKQIDLAPFYAVASGMPGNDTVADGFLVTHIRYRGFQNNIRVSTRPISLDGPALQLALEDVQPWREAGGVLISDNLGLASVHRLYDPRGASFSTRRVVQDALTAGNDLLILDKFADSGEWNAHFLNVRDVLDYLVQRYESDPTFQTQVNNSLYRIVSLKLRLYSTFSLGVVQRNTQGVSALLGRSRSLSAQVAARALTRVAPFSDDLLPPAPQEGERIVVFTQERPVILFPGATPVLPLSADMIPRVMSHLYGPDGTGQVRSGSIQQFTFTDLAQALAAETPLAPDSPAVPVLVALEQARWVVFATSGLDPRIPDSLALKTFLAQRSNLVNGQIIVLAFGPPYDLDSTEISKVDVYYALYGTGDAFVETGVRALFRDVAATGDSPVNIPAINYDLAVQTTPDPNQVITLNIVDIEGQSLVPEEISKDDLIYLRTGAIVDHNGYAVPDGTPVQFILSYLQEGIEQRISVETHDGVATTPVTLDRVGQLDFTVQSEPAPALFHLQLTIREGQSVVVVSIAPTATPTPGRPEPTPQPETPPKEQVLPEPLYLPSPLRDALLGWGLAGGLLAVVFGLLWSWARFRDPVLAVRLGLLCGVGGLVGYVLLVLVMRLLGGGILYRLADREYLAGGAAVLSGALVVATSATVQFLKRRAASGE